MQFISTLSDMRETEQHAFNSGISSQELIFRAAEAVVSHLDECKAPFAIVCGKGNNAADGYAIALLLHKRGLSCTVIRVSGGTSQDSMYFLQNCYEIGIPVERYSELTCFDHYSTIVDCLFGIGYHDPMPVEYRTIIDSINHSNAYRISVDIPSGLNANSGTGYPVHANMTVSIGRLKTGHFLNQGMDSTGMLYNHDIGLFSETKEIALFEAEDLPSVLTHRNHLSNKSTYGYVGLIGGSQRYQGALRLAEAANTAMRSGAGVVRIAFPRSIINVVAAGTLESTLFPLTCGKDGQLMFIEDEFRELILGLKVIAFGMGIGVSPETRKALLFLLHEYKGTLIIDADGLNILSGLTADEYSTPTCRIVLTPHLLEFSRLCGKTIPEIQSGMPFIARDYANDHSVVLLLKGPCTIITDGMKTNLVTRGCAGMATAGSGDVLSGIMAALCGECNDDLLTAASAAAWLNGKAGELAETEYGAAGMVSGDTARMITKVIQSLRQ